MVPPAVASEHQELRQCWLPALHCLRLAPRRPPTGGQSPRTPNPDPHIQRAEPDDPAVRRTSISRSPTLTVMRSMSRSSSLMHDEGGGTPPVGRDQHDPQPQAEPRSRR